MQMLVLPIITIAVPTTVMLVAWVVGVAVFLATPRLPPAIHWLLVIIVTKWSRPQEWPRIHKLFLTKRPSEVIPRT